MHHRARPGRAATHRLRLPVLLPAPPTRRAVPPHRRAGGGNDGQRAAHGGSLVLLGDWPCNLLCAAEVLGPMMASGLRTVCFCCGQTTPLAVGSRAIIACTSAAVRSHLPCSIPGCLSSPCASRARSPCCARSARRCCWMPASPPTPTAPRAPLATARPARRCSGGTPTQSRSQSSRW